MSQSRNLTYLGSPFARGEGEAFLLDKGDAPAYFERALNKISADKKEEKAAAQKKKADQVKALQDLPVDYHLGHTKYFQGKVQELHDKGIDLLADGVDLNNVRDPRVAEWQKEQYDLARQADLSKKFGSYAEAWVNQKEADKQKYTKESQRKMDEYFAGAKDFPADIEKFVGGMPETQLREALPEQFKKETIVTNFNKTLPTLYYPEKIEDLDKMNEVADEYAQSIIDNGKKRLSLNIAEFDATDDPEAAREVYLQSLSDQIKNTYYDAAKAKAFAQNDAKLAEAIAARKEKIALGYKQEEGRKERSNFGKTEKVQKNKTEWVTALVNGDASAIERLSNMPFVVSYDSQTGKPEYTQPTKVATVKGSEIDNLRDANTGNMPDPNIEYLKIDFNAELPNGSKSIIVRKGANTAADIKAVSEGVLGNAFEEGFNVNKNETLWGSDKSLGTQSSSSGSSSSSVVKKQKKWNPVTKKFE